MSISTGYHKKELPPKIKTLGLALLITGLIIVILGYMTDTTRSLYNNIIGFTFLVSIGVGSLFFVGLEYIVGAVWSTPFRRVSEFLSSLIIILPLFVLPLLLNVNIIFGWTHPADTMMQAKVPYLNINFFVIRVVVFWLLWVGFYFFIIKNSVKQDKTKEPSLTKTNIKLSAVFMPVFAITISLAAIDWLMSLAPKWFSTIFGVYYFSGTVLAALAAATIFIVMLNERGYLIAGLKSDHYYSLGALLFAFINFWAYISFSQFLLIWYGNLPEETVWFLARWHGNWKIFSIGLLVIHFVIPYFGLLSQPSKMNPKTLLIMALWILFGHYIDLYWLVMPNFYKEGIIFGWIELGFPILITGLIILVFFYRARKINLVAVGDPKLQRGIDFRL